MGARENTQSFCIIIRKQALAEYVTDQDTRIRETTCRFQDQTTGQIEEENKIRQAYVLWQLDTATEPKQQT